MLKTPIIPMLAALLLAQTAAVEAMPRGPACQPPAVASQNRCLATPADGLLSMIRDTQSAGRSGGGGSCWSHCFHGYNDCVEMRPKEHCVSTMKLCLETCDRLSNRPGT